MSELLTGAAAAVALAAGFLVAVPVPWGGGVPLGLVAAMAMAATLGPAAFAAAAAVATLAAGVIELRRQGRRAALHLVARAALALLAAGGAAAGVEALDGGPLAVGAAAAVAVVLVDLLWAASRAEGVPAHPPAAAPVLLTMACAAVLFTVAVGEVGVAMALVALLPLAVTGFAFARQVAASATLQQTVQALGLVPELAGLAPLGHSERAATYAAAIARELGFGAPAVDRIVTATRLHHLGAVPHDAGASATSPAEVAATGARVLRESGFPAAVADLLEEARADGHGISPPSLEAAVVRVAAAFDHSVGVDDTAVDRGLALLSGASLDPYARRAAAGLLAVVATRPTLVTDAIAAAERFTEAAAGLDLGAVTAADDAAVLPFTIRRA